MKFGAKEWFAFLISILLITDLTILLNIPFIRPIFGFLFLTILPGLLILQILKLNKLDFLEKFILIWGLSISFLMFFGLLLNNLSLGIGYESPLSTISLLVTLNVAMIALIFVAYRVNKDAIFSLPNIELSTSEKAFLIVPVMFPALSIFGMYIMNTTNNNIFLMLLLFLIPIYVAFVCFFNHKFPKRLYPVVIFLIGISLLLLLSLRSNHIIGADAHAEYHYFQTTLSNLHWSILGFSNLDACLSISLLPAIYQAILNVNSEYLQKILSPLIYSISPLVIYVISKKYVGESYGFLASCFFMFQRMFFWAEFHPRTVIAISFFALAMMTLFNERIDLLKKRILFIVFMASCLVSHYSTTYVFFFVILGMFIGIEILSKRYRFKKAISLTFILLFFAMIFFWYSQVTEGPFHSGVTVIEGTFSNLNRFFIEESRTEAAQAMLGKDIIQKGIAHRIEFVFSWLTFALIGIGLITLIIKRKEMSFPEPNFKKPDFLTDKFEIGYFVIALACAGLLIVMVALPYLTQRYGLGRVYPVAITILSVFFVIGGITLSKLFSFKTFKKSFIKNSSLEKKALPKKQKGKENGSQVWAYLIILLVLIPYFFCVTGVMYTILGVPTILLNSEGVRYDRYYVHDHYIIANEWLSSSNVVEGKLVNKQKTISNMTEYLGMFDERNRVFDNGGSEIWK